jgi:hypothetical protein
LKEYRKRNGKRLEGAGLATRMLEEIKGTMLAMAFVKLRSQGFALRISKMDGVPTPDPKEKNITTRINVEVDNGYIRKAWIG